MQPARRHPRCVTLFLEKHTAPVTTSSRSERIGHAERCEDPGRIARSLCVANPPREGAPLVGRQREARLEARLQAIAQREVGHGAGRTVVVLDVPLLVQAGLHNRCDRLIRLECEDSVRHQRLAARGLSAEQVAAREEAWSQGFPDDSSSFQAVSTVDTSADIAYTRKQIEELWEELTHGSS